jgi:hypothetical protein
MSEDLRVGLLVVDAANVVGSRPDGWWKDRAGAAERLLEQLAAGVARSIDPDLSGRRVVVVLEGRASTAATDAPASDVEVVCAPRDGDATIVDRVAEHRGDDVLVVTSDRELRRRVEHLGARTVGAGWLRDLLDGAAP